MISIIVLKKAFATNLKKFNTIKVLAKLIFSFFCKKKLQIFNKNVIRIVKKKINILNK